MTKYSHLFTEIVHSSLDLVSLYLLTERNARQVYSICLHDFFLVGKCDCQYSRAMGRAVKTVEAAEERAKCALIHP